MNIIRVILAENHALVRAGLCLLLERISDIHVIGLAADGDEALALIRRHRPHVALLDAGLSNVSSIVGSVQVRVSALTHQCRSSGNDDIRWIYNH